MLIPSIKQNKTLNVTNINKQNNYIVNDKETEKGLSIISKTEELKANNFTHKISCIKHSRDSN